MSTSIARRCAGVLLAALALALSGCTSVGPRVLRRDRMQYQESIAATWKAQTLLNFVRLRYGDPPVLLDVASIVSTYSLEAEAGVGGEFGPDYENFASPTLKGMYGDKPTITYSPVTGERLAKSMMTPLTPATILSLVQAGYRVDAVFRLTVESINGIANQASSFSASRPANPKFVPMLDALRRIQRAGALGVRVEKTEKDERAVLVIRRDVPDDLKADRALILDTLGLRDIDEFRLVFGMIPRDNREIALLSRSMIQVSAEMGAEIEVPQKDIDEGRVTPPPSFEGTVPLLPLMRVRVATEFPADAHTAVAYRGKWFYIDDRDHESKRVLGFLMMLFSLAESGHQPNLPVLTIPAG